MKGEMNELLMSISTKLLSTDSVLRPCLLSDLNTSSQYLEEAPSFHPLHFIPDEESSYRPLWGKYRKNLREKEDLHPM